MGLVWWALDLGMDGNGDNDNVWWWRQGVTRGLGCTQ